MKLVTAISLDTLLSTLLTQQMYSDNYYKLQSVQDSKKFESKFSNADQGKFNCFQIIAIKLWFFGFYSKIYKNSFNYLMVYCPYAQNNQNLLMSLI